MDNQIERPEGYYWVRNPIGKWVVSYWGGEYWLCCGNYIDLSDKFFKEIGERIIPPNEVKSALPDWMIEYSNKLKQDILNK